MHSYFHISFEALTPGEKNRNITIPNSQPWHWQLKCQSKLCYLGISYRINLGWSRICVSDACMCKCPVSAQMVRLVSAQMVRLDSAQMVRLASTQMVRPVSTQMVRPAPNHIGLTLKCFFCIHYTRSTFIFRTWRSVQTERPTRRGNTSWQTREHSFPILSGRSWPGSDEKKM